MTKFSIYRFNPETDSKPYIQEYQLETTKGMMLLDALKQLKNIDNTLSFRSSCGEGVCGSDGINVNGVNRLACITQVSDLGDKIKLRPLPGLRVIRDLVIDISQFMQQYRAVKPWLIRKDESIDQEYKQTPQQRERLDGFYECILCACCSTACPSFWWNPDKFLGPAALLQAWRFIADSRDQDTDNRLEFLNDSFKLFRCHTIANCVQVCPKDLNPTHAISNIKKKMLEKNL